MESEKMPADWAIEKAHNLLGWGVGWATVKTGSPKVYGDCIEFARYIKAHEEPPVDRKLLVAREVAARLCEWNERCAAAIRMDLHDKTCERLVAGEMAITLWEEGFAK